MPTTFLLGVDIGQQVDYTALALVERTQAGPSHPHDDGVYPVPEAPPPAQYTVRHLQRLDLHTRYPVIVERLCAMLTRPASSGRVTVLLDVTGVGRGILDMFSSARVRCIAVTMHGGFTTTQHGLEWHVPKKELVFRLASLAQARPVRLALGDRSPFAAAVRHEMASFTARINPATASESFAAWREQDHDDLIISLAMCAWWGETLGNRRPALAIPYGH
jgi:hypothetical protein